jgi:hypothetical protein
LRRKLILLNIALVALVGAAAWQLRENWRAARLRDQALAGRKVTAPPAPAVHVPPPSQPVEAAAYVDVAEHMLFSRDRNPNVAIETPPPKPVPPFPEAHGFLDLGAGPTIILSERTGAPQKSYRQGDKIGAFQIASLTRDLVVLQWEGQDFPKKMEELKPKAAAAPAANTGPAPAPEPPKRGVPNTPTPDSKLQEIQDAMKPKDGSPGLDIGGAARACVPGDTTPAGTVMGGYRKIVTQTPFGASCRWEPVR